MTSKSNAEQFAEVFRKALPPRLLEIARRFDAITDRLTRADEEVRA